MSIHSFLYASFGRISSSSINIYIRFVVGFLIPSLLKFNYIYGACVIFSSPKILRLAFFLKKFILSEHFWFMFDLWSNATFFHFYIHVIFSVNLVLLWLLLTLRGIFSFFFNSSLFVRWDEPWEIGIDFDVNACISNGIISAFLLPENKKPQNWNLE